MNTPKICYGCRLAKFTVDYTGLCRRCRSENDVVESIAKEAAEADWEKIDNILGERGFVPVAHIQGGKEYAIKDQKDQANDEYYQPEVITVLVPVQMKVHRPTSVVFAGSIKYPSLNEVEEMYQRHQLKQISAEELAEMKRWPR